MPFKKLKPLLKDILEHLNIEEATPFQKTVIPKIKSGANVYAVAPDNSGKTTALILTALQKIKEYEERDNPRVVIFVKDKQEGIKLEEAFKRFIQQMNLRIFVVNEEGNREDQRDSIYYGVDIVIATPKRFNKLYHLNGINLNDLELLIIEDANLFRKESFATDIIRISESLQKCQYVVFATSYCERLKSLRSSFMANAIKVEA
jgi:superfamily II DNA/RNA helicase